MKKTNRNLNQGWTPYRDGEALPLGKEDDVP